MDRELRLLLHLLRMDDTPPAYGTGTVPVVRPRSTTARTTLIVLVPGTGTSCIRVASRAETAGSCLHTHSIALYQRRRWPV